MVDMAYGAVHGYLGEFEKSEMYFSLAIESYEYLGNKAYMAESIYALANTYRSWGKSELALSHYHKAGEIFTYSTDSHHEFLSWYGVAMTLAEMGECSLSLNAISEALVFPGLDDYKIEIYKKKALCLVEMDSIVEARESLELAKAMSEQVPMLSDTTWQLELLQLEAVILASEGLFKNAFALMAQFHESYLRRYEEHASKRMAYLQTTMDSQGKDLEIERLQKQTLLDEIKLDKQQQKTEIQKYLTIIGLVILLGFVLFIAYQRRIARGFMNLSYQDPLTQLYNRRYIFNLMDKLIANMPPGKGQLSIIMMDVDNFKIINDTHGHAMGDKVLCKMSEICQTALRHGNDIGRIGGEEFLVVVPRESEHQTRLIAERLRTTIEKTHVVSDSNEEIRFTVSIGVAQINKDCTDTATLFKKADEALYRAKEEGKNRIVEYQTLEIQTA
ncbi:MAG: diguanylate cyclase (GGDEF)-like protein [Gammaproteobacteria bacterium]|jgi:diguanylate cyclase (GGDEF)-like protein